MQRGVHLWLRNLGKALRRIRLLSEACLIFQSDLSYRVGHLAILFSKVDQSHNDYFEGLWIKPQFLFPKVVVGTLSQQLREQPVLVRSGFRLWSC